MYLAVEPLQVQVKVLPAVAGVMVIVRDCPTAEAALFATTEIKPVESIVAV